MAFYANNSYYNNPYQTPYTYAPYRNTAPLFGLNTSTGSYSPQPSYGTGGYGAYQRVNQFAIPNRYTQPTGYVNNVNNRSGYSAPAYNNRYPIAPSVIYVRAPEKKSDWRKFALTAGSIAAGIGATVLIGWKMFANKGREQVVKQIREGFYSLLNKKPSKGEKDEGLHKAAADFLMDIGSELLSDKNLSKEKQNALTKKFFDMFKDGVETHVLQDEAFMSKMSGKVSDHMVTALKGTLDEQVLQDKVLMEKVQAYAAELLTGTLNDKVLQDGTLKEKIKDYAAKLLKETVTEKLLQDKEFMNNALGQLMDAAKGVLDEKVLKDTAFQKTMQEFMGKLVKGGLNEQILQDKGFQKELKDFMGNLAKESLNENVIQDETFLKEALGKVVAAGKGAISAQVIEDEEFLSNMARELRAALKKQGGVFAWL